MTVVVKPNAGALWAAEVNAFGPYCQLSSSLFSHCSPTSSDQPYSPVHLFVIVLSSYCHCNVLLHLATNLWTNNPTTALHLVNTEPEQWPMGDTLIQASDIDFVIFRTPFTLPLLYPLDLLHHTFKLCHRSHGWRPVINNTLSMGSIRRVHHFCYSNVLP